MALIKISLIILLLLFSLFIVLNYFSLFSTKKYTIKFNDKDREYLLHLPSGYKSSNSYPLLVALHGFGDHPRFIEQYTGFSRLSDKEKFIVVYPYGLQNSKTKKFSWNGGSCCGEAFNKKEDDVLFINNLVDELSKKYNIDSKKIYLTGFSNGGLLTYKIATEAPEKFAAFAVVSGSIGGKIKKDDPYFNLSKPKKAVPILIMHGKNDNLISYNGGFNQDQSATFTSFKDSVDFWVRNNNATKIDTIENEKFIEEKYETKNKLNSIEAYTIKDSGHAWFGSIMEYKKVLSGKSVPATKIIWNFLKNTTN